MVFFLCFLMIICNFCLPSRAISDWPLVVTTWPLEGFQSATNVAFNNLVEKRNRLESLVEGLSECERLQCDGTVGYDGSPSENGDVRLDSLIFDGVGHKIGAVGSLAIRDAARVALAVMKYTQHSLLVGEGATNFAIEMGFQREPMSVNKSEAIFHEWQMKNCQPNYRMNVKPDPEKSCGPYKPRLRVQKPYKKIRKNTINDHDTIGMIVVDHNGDLAAGTSTNGKKYKIPGRVGDSPIPGSGAYVDNNVGAAVGTGDGDILMRFAPSYLAVESMRQGYSAQESARIALQRILEVHTNFSGAIVAVSKDGRRGAACHGFTKFGYCVRSRYLDKVKVVEIKCSQIK